VYFEDLKRGTNKEFGPIDFFEIASSPHRHTCQAQTLELNPGNAYVAERILKQGNLWKKTIEQIIKSTML